LCGVPFKSAETLSSSPDHICGDCRQGKREFDSARSIGRYEDSLRELILSFKLKGALSSGRDCVILVRQSARLLVENKQLDGALHVPLNRRKLLNREFDQAAVLAQAVAEELEFPFWDKVLVRSAHTRGQAEVKNHTERRKNVRGAFRVEEADLLSGKSVLLVDDVFTSGATVAECARTMKKGGAAAVHVLTLARVLL
jgi:ComF family protein